MTNPLLLDLPTRIETDRLVLRPPQAGDGAAVFEAIAESLPELRRFLVSLPWAAGPQSVDASECFCRNGQADFLTRRDLPFLVFEKTSGRLVGATGLHRIAWTTVKAEIGYWVRASCAGQGCISESVRAVAAYAFEQMPAARLEIVTDEENEASRRVAERCGFTLEAVLRHERRAPDGSLRNTCIYSRLPDTDGLATAVP